MRFVTLFLSLIPLLLSGRNSFTIDPVLSQQMEVSPLQEILLFSETQIKKYTFDGRVIAEFQIAGDEKISAVDASNPFKILVFDENNQTIFLLDNKLKVAENKIFLSEFDILNAKDCCWGTDNTIWVYDDARKSLVNFSKNGKINKESTPISLLVANEEVDILQLLYKEGMLICSLKNDGILIFDNLGVFVKKIPIQITSNLYMLDNDTFLYLQNRDLFKYNLKAHSSVFVREFEKSPTCWSYCNSMLLFIEGRSIVMESISKRTP